MLTLSDINATTNSNDGSIYSDLFKDVYGSRPRGVTFESVEAFDADFMRLSNMLDNQIDEEKIQQSKNMEKFAQRVLETMALVNCDQRRALEIIADAEGELDSFKFYGNERLEWLFNLKFGSIAQVIEGQF